MNKKTMRKAQKLLLLAAEALFDISYELLEEASRLYWHEPNEINGEELKAIFAVHGELFHIYTDIKQLPFCAELTKREK